VQKAHNYTCTKYYDCRVCSCLQTALNMTKLTLRRLFLQLALRSTMFRTPLMFNVTEQNSALVFTQISYACDRPIQFCLYTYSTCLTTDQFGIPASALNQTIKDHSKLVNSLFIHSDMYSIIHC
jgi:hypothetical protein